MQTHNTHTQYIPIAIITWTDPYVHIYIYIRRVFTSLCECRTFIFGAKSDENRTPVWQIVRRLFSARSIIGDHDTSRRENIKFLLIVIIVIYAFFFLVFINKRTDYILVNIFENQNLIIRSLWKLLKTHAYLGTITWYQYMIYL